MDVEFVSEAIKRVQKDGVAKDTSDEVAEAISSPASRRTFHNSQGAAWILSLD